MGTVVITDKVQPHYRKIRIEAIAPEGVFLTTADKFHPWKLKDSTGKVVGYRVNVTSEGCNSDSFAELLAGSVAVSESEYNRLVGVLHEIGKDPMEVPEGCTEDLKPHFTCPICGKFSVELMNNLLASPSHTRLITLGQWYCCKQHCDQANGVVVQYNDPSGHGYFDFRS